MPVKRKGLLNVISDIYDQSVSWTRLDSGSGEETWSESVRISGVKFNILGIIVTIDQVHSFEYTIWSDFFRA